MKDVLNKLDVATEILTSVYQETNASDVSDILYMIGNFREEYIQDNGQFGAGA